MGSDIHMYIQYRKKTKPDIWWGFGKSINPGRNYVMFGILANVRYMNEKSFEPKGLPNFGLSFECEHDLYTENDEINKDFHSLSWLTIYELKKVYRWYEKVEGKVPFSYKSVLKTMKMLENNGKNEVVVVFWFDS